MNLLALAAAWPRARFAGFDLAPTAIERGRRWISAAGLRNVELEVLDILDAGDALGGPFDYVVAHGVYAWVPPPVREATMTLIGRLLAPDGVAFVSYNALPGGHLRMALRDTLLRRVEGLSGDERRLAARAHLEWLAQEPAGDDNPARAALRDAAARTLRTPWSVLSHDELGPCFHPQAVTDVARAAAANGLMFLGDADHERMDDVFLPDHSEPGDDPNATLLDHLQARDDRDFRFFRQTLLVRADARPSRRPDQAGLAALWATSRCRRDEDGRYRIKENVFEVADPMLDAALARLIGAFPERLRVAELVDGDAHRVALWRMFDRGLVELHTGPAPFAAEPGERPLASPLVRALLAEGAATVPTLDHRMITIEDYGPRHLIAHLDGTRTLAELEPVGRDAGLATPDALIHALRALAREALLVR